MHRDFKLCYIVERGINNLHKSHDDSDNFLYVHMIESQ